MCFWPERRMIRENKNKQNLSTVQFQNHSDTDEGIKTNHISSIKRDENSWKTHPNGLGLCVSKECSWQRLFFLLLGMPSIISFNFDLFCFFFLKKEALFETTIVISDELPLYIRQEQHRMWYLNRLRVHAHVTSMLHFGIWMWKIT